MAVIIWITEVFWIPAFAGMTGFFVIIRWAEINGPQTPLEEKLSFPPMAAFAGVNSDGNPRIYGGERKVQLIMFTYLTLTSAI